MKSYNMQALRGHEYTDHEFQADMRESGVDIPDSFLYKPALGRFVIDEMYKKNVIGLREAVNPKTHSEYTENEARDEANTLRDQATKNYNKLL